MKRVETEMFGMHVLRRETSWPHFQLAVLRLWDTVQWPAIEQRRRDFDFSALDEEVGRARRSSVQDVVFTFGRVPTWASARPATPCVYAGNAFASIETIVRHQNIVTVSVDRPLQFQAGKGVGIGDVSDASFDGGFSVLGVTGPKSFTYSGAGVDAQSSGGTVFNEGGCRGPVQDARDLAQFAESLVRRYCGVIRYWELWNEPDLGDFWGGGTPDLVSQASVLYPLIKDAQNCACVRDRCSPGEASGSNPNIVLSPSPSTLRSTWLDSWLLAGGAKYFDVFAFHGYGFEDDPEDLPQFIQRARESLAAAGKPGVPLWDTEGGWGREVGADVRKRASWLARAYLLQAAAGVERFIWYAYDNPKWGTLWTPEQGENAAAVAYREVESWMIGATVGPCDVAGGGVWACSIKRDGKPPAHAVWNPRGKTVFEVPAGWHAKQWRDLSGGTHVLNGPTLEIDDMPVLIEN